MNCFYKLLLAGSAACMTSLASAQTLSPATIRTDDMNGGRPGSILVVGGNRTTLLYKLGAQEVDPRQMPYSRVKSLIFIAPEEYVTALQNYQNAKYKEARATFANVRTKYAATEALPGNYAVKAAFYEVDSLVRLLDWAAVKNLTPGLTKNAYLLTGNMPTDAEVYALLGKLADNTPDAVIESGNAMLANKAKWNLRQTGRIAYALGVSHAAKGDQKKALDSFAMTMVAHHGGDLDLVASAITKSMDLLAADETVVKFMQSPPQELPVKARIAPATVPAKMQELAALAYMYKHVLFPNRVLDAKYEPYLRFAANSTERFQLQKQQRAAAEQAPAGESPGDAEIDGEVRDEVKEEAGPAPAPAPAEEAAQ